jgi:hypothetical protein
MNGKALYDLYRKEPPARTHMSGHSCAYWQGYDDIPFKHVRGSYAWWANKAGKDNRKEADRANRKGN